MSSPNTRYSKLALLVWLTICAMVLIAYSFLNETAFPAVLIFGTAALFAIIIAIIQGSDNKLEITVKGFRPTEGQIIFAVNKIGSAYIELIQDDGVCPHSGDKLTVQYLKNLDKWKIVKLTRRSSFS